MAATVPEILATLHATMETRAVRDLKPGDMIDLAGDKYADPDTQSVMFECEYAVVADVTPETPECIAIDIEGVDVFGFPPDHLVPYAGRDPGYDA